MAKSFMSLKYIESMVVKILNSLEVQRVIQHPTRVWVSSDQPQTRERYDEEYLFKSWLNGQIERYGRVYDTIADYFQKEGMILPAEPKDFMKWYVNNVIAKGDYLSEQIEATDFNLYHEEMLKTLNKTNKWNDLYKELSENGYIFTTPEVFNYVMEFKQLPGGKEKIQWRTVKADAITFQIEFKFERKHFNKCFRSDDGRIFTGGSIPKGPRKRPLKSIIDRYKPKSDNL